MIDDDSKLVRNQYRQNAGPLFTFGMNRDMQACAAELFEVLIPVVTTERRYFGSNQV